MTPAAIDRYIFSAFIPYFLISVALFSFVFVSDQLLEISNYIVNHGIGLTTVSMLLIYSFPYFLEYVIPISTMIAVLLVFLGMSADNEIVALKSSGVSVYRLLWPVLIFSFGTGLLTAVMALYGVPWGQLAFKKVVYKTITTGVNAGITEREFTNTLPGVMLYVGEMDPVSHDLTDVLLEDSRPADDTSLTISAPSGRFSFDPGTRRFSLHLEKGLVNQVNLPDRSANSIRFERYTINYDLPRPTALTSGKKDEKEMWPGELYHYLQTASADSDEYLSARLEFSKKGAIPFACLALGLLAFPMGIQTMSRKKSSGVGLALVCFLFYYLLLSIGESLAETGAFPPWLGTWLPNVVMTAAALWFLFLAANDRSIKEVLPRFFHKRRFRLPTAVDRKPGDE